MNKKLIGVIVFVILLTVTITGVVNAQLPGSGWWSSYMAQNIGTENGLIQTTAYDSKSDSVYSGGGFYVDPGFGLIYDPGKSPNYESGGPYIGFSDPLPSGFEGSLVLSSSIPVAAVSQLSNYRNGSVGTATGAASGMYQAFPTSATSTELLFPIIKNNWANAKTSVFIQAASLNSEVTITYNMGDGSTYQTTQLIEANKMFMFDPSAAGVPESDCGDNFNISPCFGAATVTGTTPFAGVIVEHPYSGSPIGAILSTRGLSSADEDTVLFAPNIKNDYYYAEATACIMNIGENPALVRGTIIVTFGPNTGEQYVQDLEILPDQTMCFSKWLDTLGGMPKGNFASARFESVTEDDYTAQPLVGSVNHSKFQGKIPMGRARENYYLYSISSATDTVYSPYVKEFSDEFTGGLTVVNVGDQPARIHFEYYDYESDTVYEFWSTNLIQPGAAIDAGRVSYNEPERFENDGTWAFEEMRGKQFSVITYSENGEKIISLTTIYDNYWAYDKFYDMMSYEGLSVEN